MRVHLICRLWHLKKSHEADVLFISDKVLLERFFHIQIKPYPKFESVSHRNFENRQEGDGENDLK